MGKYTVSSDPEVDRQVQAQLDTIARVVREGLPEVRSILLFGGFGRGEGSVRWVGDKVLPLKDYDIRVIMDSVPPGGTLSLVKQKIYQELGLPNPEEGLFAFSSFVVDIFYTTRANLRLFPDISTYELKVASQVLYGEDFRDLIPWTIDDIPLSSGFRFLMEKMTGLIGHFPEARFFGTGPLDAHEKELLLYECNKIYIEIATVLCLLNKKLVPSFAQRAQIIAATYASDFPELFAELPDLPQRIAEATECKLKGAIPGQDDDEAKKTWLSARHYLGTVLRYYIWRYLGVRVTDWASSADEIERALHRQYFRPLIANFLRQKGLPANRVSVALMNRLLPAAQTLQFARSTRGNGGRLRPFWLFATHYPVLRLYATVPLLVFAVEEDRLNLDYLKRADDRLRSCVPARLPSGAGKSEKEAWKCVREAYLKAYRLCTLAIR